MVAEAMASSLSSAASKVSLLDRVYQFSSVSVALPRYAQQSSCQKEILGTPILPHQNHSLHDPSIRQQQKLRPLTIKAAKRVDTKRSFILNATLKAQDEEVTKVAKLCDDVRQWASEKKKDKAAGCKQFDCYVDIYDKNVFHFMEEYSSALHMNDFRASPEYTKFCEEVRPLLQEPIALAIYELRDGKLGTMLNPIGPKGEGGLDDATGQSGRGGEAYMKPKAKKKRGIEFESKVRAATTPATTKVEESKWSFEKIIARVLGQDSSKPAGTDLEEAKEEQWSFKSLFGRKK